MSGVLNDCDTILQAAPVRFVDPYAALLAALAELTSDDLLSPSEKPAENIRWTAILGERAGIDASAAALGITTERTAYTNAYNTLNGYIVGGLGAAFTTIPGSAVPIVGATYRTNFTNYFSAKQTLLNAITAASAMRAAYSSVTGKPDVYRIVTSGGANTASLISPQGLYVNGTHSMGVRRSYVLAVIRRSDHAIVHLQNYDVYGNGADSAGRNAATLAGDLNNFANSPGQYIVVVYSGDEPYNLRLTGGLDSALYRNGASRAVFGSPQFQYRATYALIGISGCGEGNGAEAYQGAVVEDPNSWIDVTFQLYQGQILGVTSNYKPKTLQDFSYTGDMNATSGAPAGTNVAGVPAETVVAKANNALPAAPTFAINFNGDGDIYGAANSTLSAGFSVNPAGYTGSYSVDWSIRVTSGRATQGPYLIVTGNSASVTATSNTGVVRFVVTAVVTHSGGLTASAGGSSSLNFGSA